MIIDLSFGYLDLVTFRQYYKIKEWLKIREIEYKFIWADTGKYLPTNIDIPNDEDAIAFKLVYGTFG